MDKSVSILRKQISFSYNSPLHHSCTFASKLANGDNKANPRITYTDTF